MRELAVDDDAPRGAGNVIPRGELAEDAVDVREGAGQFRAPVGIGEAGGGALNGGCADNADVQDRRARREQQKDDQAIRFISELVAGRGLIGADATGGDVGDEIVLGAHRRSGQAPQHADLADVRQQVGDGP